MRIVTFVMLGTLFVLPRSASGEEPVPTSPNAKGGTLKGTIAFQGDIPPREKIIRKGTAYDKNTQTREEHDLYSEELLVDARTHGIASVYVYMIRKPVGWKPDYDTSQPVKIEAVNGRYTPHASLALIGQTITVKSRDANSFYAPHFYTIKNPAYCALPDNSRGSTLYSEIFRAAEPVPIQVRCDIHNWMNARILVLDHPFAAITNEQGEFTISGIPEGSHEFRIWHERTGWLEKTLTVTIQDGQTTDLGQRNYPAELFEMNR